MLKGVAAGVYTIVRSFLALWRTPRPDSSGTAGKIDARTDDAATTDGAMMAADAAVIAANATVIAADMSAITIDATAIAADAAERVTVAVAAAPEAAGTGAAARAPADAAPATTDVAAPDVIAPGAATAVPATVAVAAPSGPVRSVKLQGRKVMSSGFDMQAEIARLAERIIEPVAARLTAQELEQVVGRTRDAFERFNADRAAPDVGFGTVAAAIIEPVRASLTDVEHRRAVDRLSGAMAAFCQGLGRAA